MWHRPNPLDGFSIDPEAILYAGEGLQRPECILAEPDGSLWSADARGGVVHIRPDGTQSLIAQTASRDFAEAGDEETRFVSGTLPNGLAFARNGDILISNFGTDRLEVMTRSGETRVLVDAIDGQAIGKINFVLRDSKDRIWLTVSTRTTNWMRAMSPHVRDGYVALYDRGRLRIVADGFAFTNEIRLDAREEWLYVAETCACRVTRLRVAPDGSLTGRETFGPRDHGAFIDGIAFDAHGNLWGTHVMIDRVFAITPQGDLRILLDDDRGSAAGKALMAAFARGEATPELMLACGGTIAPWFASITFGGPDLRTVHIGSLRGSRIPCFRSPVAGLPMAHWHDRQQGRTTSWEEVR
ncbi:SMP-30/gluconolactonase/LRE family protein [Bosea sp. CS1GBMeth4]|uniref:SMP-30/gluconolactonase/LRE family protein n=1 Tax=Bosea sp. CS1GBMeth4 TaxID=1892849 RepID=UPI0016496188|nr:SMP-30/gluconolactonase/LRE family protein [Bosea sp. CS1GBMeth4]